MTDNLKPITDSTVPAGDVVKTPVQFDSASMPIMEPKTVPIVPAKPARISEYEQWERTRKPKGQR